ncbi:MAG: MFS transporter [Bacteroidota bacterium]
MRQLLRQHPRYLTFGFLHFFFSAVGQTFFISLFVAGMSARMDWADGTFAGIYSAVTLAAAFLLPIIGPQVDRFKVRYVSTITTLALIGGCILLGLSSHLALLLLGLFVVRLGGQGVLTLTGSTVIERYFNAGRGRALSISIIGISVAEVVMPPAVVFLMERQGYESVWLVAAATLALLFIPAIWLLVRRYDSFQQADTVAAEQAATSPAQNDVRSWTRAELLRDRRFHLLIPVFIFIPFVFTGLVFNQSVLAGARGYAAAWMALGLSAYGLTRVVCLLTAGGFADRYGPAALLRYVYAPTVIGLILLIVVQQQLSVPLFFGLMGVTAGIESVIWPALWAERYGPRYLGSIKSTVRVVVVVASAAAPIVFSYGFGWGINLWLMITAAYGVLCLLLVGVERKTKVRR